MKLAKEGHNDAAESGANSWCRDSETPRNLFLSWQMRFT